MTQLKLLLRKDKTTKNSVRFIEDSDDHPVAIYLLKSKVTELGDPETIEVTIEAA